MTPVTGNVSELTSPVVRKAAQPLVLVPDDTRPSLA